MRNARSPLIVSSWPLCPLASGSRQGPLPGGRNGPRVSLGLLGGGGRSSSRFALAGGGRPSVGRPSVCLVACPLVGLLARKGRYGCALEPGGRARAPGAARGARRPSGGARGPAGQASALEVPRGDRGSPGRPGASRGRQRGGEVHGVWLRFFPLALPARCVSLAGGALGFSQSGPGRLRGSWLPIRRAGRQLFTRRHPHQPIQKQPLLRSMPYTDYRNL